MKTSFYYTIDSNKGYIPSDKIKIKNYPFENANGCLEIETAKKYWLENWHIAKKLPSKIILSINEAIEKYKKQTGVNICANEKMFYINFNSDKVQVFINRHAYTTI